MCSLRLLRCRTATCRSPKGELPNTIPLVGNYGELRHLQTLRATADAMLKQRTLPPDSCPSAPTRWLPARKQENVFYTTNHPTWPSPQLHGTIAFIPCLPLLLTSVHQEHDDTNACRNASREERTTLHDTVRGRMGAGYDPIPTPTWAKSSSLFPQQACATRQKSQDPQSLPRQRTVCEREHVLGGTHRHKFEIVPGSRSALMEAYSVLVSHISRCPSPGPIESSQVRAQQRQRGAKNEVQLPHKTVVGRPEQREKGERDERHKGPDHPAGQRSKTGKKSAITKTQRHS
ncbi:hypothetical protein VOLCADRAFT_107812 [Volvox carteri f. nagariensis]|uniref:Uncharacterized protein n=1 Tax=Volvox carteri f. nagariensis TaxID=3068 RepID=D8UGL8_VOLCA|nr:uncharacterized protein VOLCADRAFT_107812 [Volvox carteri f. nagariensis]EFJ41121.1 hypothetical protein VOLCADRAFT_107812 [Volvox carteri f. nagariensis]|eukprot:XP_002957793.1 hypothetical protein VOLCADRAFT_107812 [Volvox carteri f. nagariensis]